MPRVAYLSNIKTTTLKEDNDDGHAAVICFFYDEEGSWFKSYIKFKPYFYIKVHEDHSHDVISYLGKLFESKISVIENIEKIDLDDIQHMSGVKSTYIKLSFNTIPVSRRVTIGPVDGEEGDIPEKGEERYQPWNEDRAQPS